MIFIPHARTTVRAQTRQNYVQQENAKPGTTDWKLTNPGWTSGVIEGYADVTSVNRGGQIKFFVNTSDPTFTIEIFRIGYYQGLGGRRMTNPVTFSGTKQTIPSPDPDTGLIECNWINPYVFTIPNSADPTDWMSGYYYAKLTSSSGKQWYITFVVRDDARSSDLIMAQAVTTAEAYNVWGGKSLYGTLADRSDTANASRKTSFLRPYYGDETWGAGQFSSQNDFKFWEWGMVQFLEQNGYDVTYATNIDVDRNPNLLLTHKAFLSVGHDEYWSWRMRDNVEHARDVGVNLGFFSANTSYWQVRFEDSAATGQPYSVMVGYKDYCNQDPITPTYLRTCRFRDPQVNRSEDQMLGIMYVTQSRQPFVVEDASHWLFTNTGLKNGDTLVNPDGSYFVGYEVDALGPHSPLNLERAAHSPATPKHANFSDMTVYRASSGATVFASGSILWTYTVPQIVQVTKNALARLIGNAFVDAPPMRPPLPAPFQSMDIGDVGRAGFVALADTDSFTLNGAGQDTFTGSDALFYVYQGLQGDGSITARIAGLQNYWNNRAGLMIRESLSPGGRYVSLVSRPSDSKMNGTSGVNEGVEFNSKTTFGGRPAILAQQDLPMPNWVRLTRAGNLFDAYVSADGSTWTHLGSTTLAMNGTIYIGAAVASSQHAVWLTASFDHVGVAGGSTPPPPDTAPPSVTIASPAAGATVSGTVSVTASATDNMAIAGVQFKLDGANFGNEVTSAPYTVPWNTASASNGSHTLSAVARDTSGNTAASSSVSVTVSNVPMLPTGWSHADIGAVGSAGSAAYDSTTRTFTVTGAGADVWGTADAFQYAYTTLTGDGTIVARVATISAGASWIKAGVMLRDTLDPSSAHGFMLVSYAKGLAFQRRVTAGGLSTSTAVSAITAPRWVKLQRTGSTITASHSADGVAWTIVDTDTIAMGSKVLAGLAVSSHTTAATATATFDNVAITTSAPPPDTTPPTVSVTAPAPGATVSGTVSVSATASDNVGIAGVQFKLDGANIGAEVTSSPYAIAWNTASTANGSHTLTAVARDSAGNTGTSAPVSVTVSNAPPPPPGNLPSGWSHGDIGAVGAAGSASYDSTSSTFTVTGAGADIWGTADAFHYAYMPVTGDATIVARVATISPGAAWIKAGVMLRDTVDASTAHGFMLVSYSKGTAFQRRTATAAISTSTAGGSNVAPWWVKLQRAGNTFTASQSADGVTWAVVATDSIPMGTQILAGLAVSSHTTTATATATFDHVSVTAGSAPPSDTTAPTVAMSAPASGATVTGTITLSANASDNVAVAGVQFTLDGANLGPEIPTAPYNASWNTTSVANGAHTLTAVARDAAGNKTTSAPVTVTVNNAAAGQCSSVTLSQTSFYSGAPASNWSITVTAPSSTCTWTASIDQPWLILNNVNGPTTLAGTGSAVISLQTTANTTGAFRYGTFTIGGATYKVTQEF